MFAKDIAIGFTLPVVTIEVTAKAIVMGATASRDWQPLHHDHVWAVEQGGLPSIIANNYTQSGWISRCITDASGHAARIGRLRLRMRRYICPDDTITFRAVVGNLFARDDTSRWVQFEVELRKAEDTVTTASVLVALPWSEGDPSPWRRHHAPPPFNPSSM